MSLTDIDTNLLRVFSEQIFHTGFVHADPHPGNILIRKVDGKAQIVLLGKIYGKASKIIFAVRSNSACKL